MYQITVFRYLSSHPRSRVLDVTQRSVLGERCVTSKKRLRGRLVFELSGKFITKFRSKAESKGEFNLPTSTAVLSDGRIAVSEFSNNHIKIFEWIDSL